MDEQGKPKTKKEILRFCITSATITVARRIINLYYLRMSITNMEGQGKQKAKGKKTKEPKTKKEILRFCITGATITAVLYGIYYAMLYVGFSVDISFTTGFVVSFICNFLLTNYYTFRTPIDAENALRFTLCQALNFLMQYAALKLFVALGVPEEVALVPVWVIIFPINFLWMRKLLRSQRFRIHKTKKNL